MKNVGEYQLPPVGHFGCHITLTHNTCGWGVDHEQLDTGPHLGVGGEHSLVGTNVVRCSGIDIPVFSNLMDRIDLGIHANEARHSLILSQQNLLYHNTFVEKGQNLLYRNVFLSSVYKSPKQQNLFWILKAQNREIRFEF